MEFDESHFQIQIPNSKFQLEFEFTQKQPRLYIVYTVNKIHTIETGHTIIIIYVIHTVYAVLAVYYTVCAVNTYGICSIYTNLEFDESHFQIQTPNSS